MKILVFDNYDSFTYNLVHLVEKICGLRVEVRRNDQIPLEEVNRFDKIILSPGPGLPCEAGLLLPLIREYAPYKSILGVCLGHQAIGESFGGKLVNLTRVFHGVATRVRLGLPGQTGQDPGAGNGFSQLTGPAPIGASAKLFRGMPEYIEAGRYHSWIVSDEGFPPELEVTARDDYGYIMAMQHRNYDLQGVQFHPESVLTPEGEKIMRNWLNA
jgi:anthranilate synthase component 2